MSSGSRPVPQWLTGKPIAHRGLHRLPNAPENSLRAFAAAVETGLPIELDVRLLADRTVAVFHDHDLKRLTGAEGLLKDQSAQDIRELRLQGTNERIPLLCQTLDLVAGRVPILIELKTDPLLAGPLEEATIEVLSGYAGAYAFQSFSTATVAFLAAHAPSAVRGQLASDDRWRGAESDLQNKSDFERGTLLPDFLAYHLPALPTPRSTRLRARGLPLLAWTIQTREQQKQAREVADNYIFEGLPLDLLAL